MKTKQLPKVAVLLAAYNGEKYIQEQIESIVNQVDVDIYIYISIDASTDRTLEICEKLQKIYKNIFIINESKERFGSAGKNFYYLIKNVDFEEFDFIALSDQDDIWKPAKIIRGIQLLEEERAFGYSSDVECFWDAGDRKNKIIKKSYPQKKYDYYFEPAGPGCTYILTKKLTLSIQRELYNLINPPYHHDWYIYAFARANNFKWHIDNQPNIYYRQHQKNQIGANIGLQQYIKRFKKIKSGSFNKELLEILKSINIDEKQIRKLNILVLKNPFAYRRNHKEAIILALLYLFKIQKNA
ncbi:glycosyltransferase [Comamonas jiangduensis]|uniref:glycosyltransferase n=1 Tax=Comamonas jiangduensis TaxID=1194168 RepID=UPI0024E14030|nr:glycosyltransferase [Comamonas jiangduensis]